jgi:SDR family mycofactocin-dependent oxidoreductase
VTSTLEPAAARLPGQAEGRVAGKVALITGAGRGQGRAHCLHLAAQGADIIALDVGCVEIGVGYGMASAEDLAETCRQVRQLGRRAWSAHVDVRDREAMQHAVEAGVAELGRLDVVVANAGVGAQQRFEDLGPATWEAVIGINLTGTWNTLSAAIPHLLAQGGGSVICIGSTGAVKGLPFMAPYVASKHAIVGLAKSVANEFASRGIRVNVVHPTGVATPMVEQLDNLTELIAEVPDTGAVFTNALPVRLIDAADVAHAVVYLASEESRFVTGSELRVDAGNALR